MNSTHETSEHQALLEGLLGAAATRALAYLRDSPGWPVAPAPPAVDALSEIDQPLPHAPTRPADVLALLDRVGSPATVVTTGGRYFGFVNGGALPASVAASWLASAWDQNVALRVMSPAAAAFEDVALEWVRDLLGLPAGCGSALVNGATLASFTALALLGLGRGRVRSVRVEAQGRMRAEALPPLDARTIVCIQAGNVNTGSFDPAAEICRRARDAGAWVHVDGAFGLWAAASPKLRHLTDGVELADSWATDGHKWPNVGYDCGMALVRDAAALRAAMANVSAYFVPGEQREPSQFSPEMSRRARGVELWASLRSLGRHGLAELFERTCGHAQAFARGLRESGYDVLNDVVLNQVLVSFGAPAVTRAVIDRVQRDGTCWCGGTEWQGHVAMRISVSSWATTDDDVRASLEAIRRAARLRA